jgi:hypothetical protein
MSAVIVENLDTGLALPEMPGTVAVMKLGNAVAALDRLPWLRGTDAIYWGDIDTHGFAILDRARRVLPDLSLRSNSLGQNVRLEQERLPWEVAVRVIRDALRCPG